MKINEKDTPKIEYKIEIADISDAEGIYTALKSNLVEIQDLNLISETQRRELEENGFLRKEVDLGYYQNLIQNQKTEIYIAKTKEGQILGFASIHKEQSDIKKLRNTLDNLYIDNQDIEALLMNKEKSFIYLDQISIIKKYKRKGIATKLMEDILENNQIPIVAFIVKKPLYNKASALWHKFNGFKLVGTADGYYKDKLFEWLIYIHWNKR